MAGNKTIYNATNFECQKELLFREQGVILDPAFMHLGDAVADRTHCTLTLRGRTSAETGGTVMNHGTATYRYRKFNLLSRLPTDLVYTGPYPTTVENFINQIALSFNLRFELDDLSLVTGVAEVPLENSPTMGSAPDINNRIQLRTRDVSQRWVGGQDFYIYIADPRVSAWAPLTIAGNAPDGSAELPYTFQYQISGGAPPYSIEVVNGLAPKHLNPETGAFEGPYTAAGDLEWTLRVTDSRGMTFDRTDSAYIAQTALAISTGTLPNGAVGQPYSAMITATGGALGHRFNLRDDGGSGATLDSDGRLHGEFDSGLYTLVVRVTDHASQSVERELQFRVVNRSNAEIAQSIMSKLSHWFDLHDLVNDPGRVVLASYVNGMQEESLAVHGVVNSVEGPRDGALEMVDGYMSADIDVRDNFGVMVSFNSPQEQPGVGLIGRASAVLGWELIFDSVHANTLEFNCVINTQPYNVRTQGLEDINGEGYRTVVAQRFGRTMSIGWNGEFVAHSECAPHPLMRTELVPLTVGKRLVNNIGNNWRVTIDRIVIFRDRLWRDELAYLHNNGSVRRYLDVAGDAA